MRYLYHIKHLPAYARHSGKRVYPVVRQYKLVLPLPLRVRNSQRLLHRGLRQKPRE